MCMGRVTSLVRVCLQLPGHQGAVLSGSCLYLKFNGMAYAGTPKGFLPGYLHPHAAPSHLGGKECVQRFIEHILLVAKAASDIRLDNTDPAHGQPQGLADDAAHNMGNLGGCGDNDAVLFHIGKGYRCLNMAGLHALGPVIPVDYHQPFLFHRLLKGALSHGKGRVCNHIAWFFLMKPCCPFCHGCFHGQQRFILLILHLDQAGRPGSGNLILCNHGSNVIAVYPDPGIEQLPVSNVLVGCLHRPWMAWSGELDIRHIKTCDNLHNPRDSQCLA